MTSPFKNRLLCAALLLSSFQLGIAQSPTDLNAFSFGPPTTPVWDISGTYQLTNHLQGAKLQPLDIILTGVALNVDAHGHVQGGGTILVLVGTDLVGGDYKVSGNITGGGTKTRVNFSFRFKGNGIVAGVITTCNISTRYNLVIDPVSMTMAGKTTGNAHFSQLGSGNFKSDIALPVPPGANGGWNVTLQIVQFGTKLTGTAVVLVTNAPSSTTLTAKVNGNLPKQSATAKVNLTGSGNSAGTHLNMSFTPILGATNLTAAVRGKVLGQSVKN